jgi:hypothetical protein
MKKLLTLPNILIVILIGIIVFDKCTPGKKPEIIKVDGKPYEVLKWEIDTQYVSKKVVVTKPGETIIKDTTIYVEVPQKVDTSEILKDFYSKNVYKDTLNLPDSLGFVSLSDTIYQNKILFRSFSADVREKIITDTKIVKELPKTQVYLGFNTQLSQPEFVNSIGGSILLKTKKDKVFQLGAGVTSNNLSPYVNGGIYWKIKFK